MLILGFNEIMALLGNPLLLFLFVVLGLMAYAAWLAGLLDVPLQIATGTGPPPHSKASRLLPLPSLISGGLVLLTSTSLSLSPLPLVSELWSELTGRAKSAAVQSVMGRLTGAPATGKDKKD